MADAISNQREIERRQLVWSALTTMNDKVTALGYDGDPNDVVQGNSDGEDWLYGLPIGHLYKQSDATLWWKTGSPNTWEQVATGSVGTGDVSKVGTPANDQVGVWTGDGTIEGDTDLTFDGSNLSVGGNIVVGGTVDGVNIGTDVPANTAKVTNATHTGDVTGSGALTISADAVTYAKMQNVVADDVLLGNTAGAGGPVAELSASDVRTLINVEDGADVTDATNVNAAGATMNADTTLAGNSYFLDEDNMVSDDATKVASQQSIKAYVDTKVSSAKAYKGGYNAATNTPDLDTSPSSSISSGDVYDVTAAGTFFTIDVEVGDMLTANQDSPTLESHWVITQANLTPASIKTQYESNADTNAYTNDEKTKVGHISVTQAVDLDTMESNITTNNAKVTNATHTGDVTGDTALTIAVDAVDIPMLSASGTADATTFLRGDNTWSVPAGSGDVSKVGTPVDNQVGVWTGDGTIEGTSGLTYSGTALDVTGNITLTGTVDGVNIGTDVPANTSKVSNATHTGDVTGATALTIANDAVTYAKMQNIVSDNVLLGNNSGAGAPVEELSATEVRSLLNVADGATAVTVSDVAYNATSWDANTDPATKNAIRDKVETMDTAIGLNTAKVTNATHTGDVTGDTALTIAADAVTYAKMQNVVADDVLLGNIAGAGGIVAELTATQVRTLLNVADGATAVTVSDVAYNATTWDANTDAATKNAIRDKIETMDTAIGLNTAKVTNATHTGDVTGDTALTIAAGAVDIAMLSATGTPDSTTFLRGDNTWSVPAGSGDVSKVGTPVDNQVGVWTGDGTLEGTSGLTYSGTALDITGNITLTGTVDGVNIGTDVPANTLKVTNATHTGDVTGSGALTIAADAVTYAKMQNVVADDVLLGNIAGAGGAVAELSASDVRTMLNVADGATAVTVSDVAYDDTSWNANTDAASKNAIRDKINTMDTAIGLNTAKVTNATHSGDATGATALTLANAAITGKGTVTAVGTDYVLLSDTSDSGNLKKALVSDILGSATDPAGSDGQIQYNNGGAFGAASAIYYDDANNRLGINTATPTADIEVFNSSDTESAQVVCKTFSNSGFVSHFVMRSSRGTSGTPLAILDTSPLGNVYFQGQYDGSNVRTGGLIRSVATENWSGSVSGTEFQFWTVAAGGTTISSKHVMTGAGDFKLSTGGVLLNEYQDTDAAGAIEWNGSNFRGYTGSAWVNLDAQAGPPTPAGSDTQIQYNDSGSLGADANFVWNDTSEYLGIGTTTPSWKVDARTSADENAIIGARCWNSSGFSAMFVLHSGRGSEGAANALVDTSPIGQIYFQGQYSAVGARKGALLVVRAEENWGASNGGAGFEFETTAIGSTTATKKFTMTGGGDFQLASGGLLVKAYQAADAAGAIEWNGSNFRGYTGSAWVNLDTQSSSTAPGGSDGQIQYNNGSAFGGTAGAYWDDVNDIFVVGPSTYGDAYSSGQELQIQSTTNARMLISSYGNQASGSSISFAKHRGTFASPATVVVDDVVMGLGTAVNTSASFHAAGSISCVVTGTVTSTVAPTSLVFKTNDTATAVERFRITDAGSLTTGGETAPDTAPGGVCLNTGSSLAPFLTYKNSTVSHPFTGIREADTVCMLGIASATEGGVLARGFSESTTSALKFEAYQQTGEDSDNSAGAIHFVAQKSDGGTSSAALADTDNGITFHNGTAVKLVVKGSGDILSDAGIQVGAYGQVASAGAIQWDGSNFLGYNGTSWIALDGVNGDPTIVNTLTTDNQCLRIAAPSGNKGHGYATQVVLAGGNTYRIMTRARSDGNLTPIATEPGVQNYWVGVNTTTDWQDVDIQFTPSSTTTLYLGFSSSATTGHYVEFDNVFVELVSSPGENKVSDGDMEAIGTSSWTPLGFGGSDAPVLTKQTNNADVLKVNNNGLELGGDTADGSVVLRAKGEGEMISTSPFKISVVNGPVITQTAVSNIDVDSAATENVDTFDSDSKDGFVEWSYFVKNGANLRSGRIMAHWDASAGTAAASEISTPSHGDTAPLTFTVDMSAANGDVRLRADATTDNWEVHAARVRYEPRL